MVLRFLDDFSLRMSSLGSQLVTIRIYLSLLLLPIRCLSFYSAFIEKIMPVSSVYEYYWYCSVDGGVVDV